MGAERTAARAPIARDAVRSVGAGPPQTRRRRYRGADEVSDLTRSRSGEPAPAPPGRDRSVRRRSAVPTPPPVLQRLPRSPLPVPRDTAPRRPRRRPRPAATQPSPDPTSPVGAAGTLQRAHPVRGSPRHTPIRHFSRPSRRQAPVRHRAALQRRAGVTGQAHRRLPDRRDHPRRHARSACAGSVPRAGRLIVEHHVDEYGFTTTR
jgi:hypothetical protein